MDKDWSDPRGSVGAMDERDCAVASTTRQTPRRRRVARSVGSLSQLVAQVYASAPLPMKRSLLDQLMGALGVLTLLQIGTGVFARIRRHSGRPDEPIALEQVRGVGMSDVVALVERVQLQSLDALTGLAQLLDSVPAMGRTAALVALLQLLHSMARTRRDIRKVAAQAALE